MIHKRLIASVKESRRYIAAHVACQWFSLLANIVMMGAIARLLAGLYRSGVSGEEAGRSALMVILALAVRFFSSLLSSHFSYLSSKAVKEKLRTAIYQKLLRLGSSYRERVATSEVVQVAVEGVEQLETYFGAYLPQFFYALLAPLTLFFVLSFVSLEAALTLLLLVPLIPVSIVAVQRWAKRLLARYWGQYSRLGDSFLENLQGLVTTKIYQSDAYKHEQMNEESERFRRITMKVLMMQLNSISIMDLIAYGGAALGVILSARGLQAGRIELSGALLIILLAAEFFLPLRQLGSFFHVSMNGMAAADKIFHLLDLPEGQRKTAPLPADLSLRLHNLSFAYEAGRNVLCGVSMDFSAGHFSAIAGESGCGKSTVAALLTGRLSGYSGSLTVGGMPLSEIDEESLNRAVTYVSHQSYLFKGTVRENLLVARPYAQDEQLWQVLEEVRLADFLRAGEGLDSPLEERAANLSGGQCQRLAMARALLHDSPVYIFDEATSNIDVESERDIMAQIRRLARTKTVILISHRLANMVDADRIHVLQDGVVVEAGRHAELLAQRGVYARLWQTQQELESFVVEEVAV
ncbi:MAG: ABC transporter ATP-binding protein/permease [Bacillota bacterium]|nr:ABC transporter ATP-binding protein/permease [Bacillota bacterium]